MEGAPPPLQEAAAERETIEGGGRSSRTRTQEASTVGETQETEGPKTPTPGEENGAHPQD